MKKILYKIEKHKELIFCIIAVLLIAIYAISISPKTVQNDIFYNVAIGKYISENGIDMKEHFSWHEDLSYTYPHWLYDLGMYKIFNIGGWDAIYISTCVLSIILGICIFYSNSRLTKNKLISLVTTIAVMYLIKDYITARAQLVTFSLFMLLVYNIERFIETKSKKNAIALLLIHTLMANLHVAVWPFSFVLYLPYIAEYLVSEVIDIVLYSKIHTFILRQRIKRSKQNKQVLEDKLKKINQINQKIAEKRKQNEPYKIIITKNKNVRWLVLIMIIAAFTGLLTPLGNVPYTYNYLTLIGNTMQNINEHLPLTLANNIQMECTLVIIFAILTFSNSKIKLADLFMLGGLCYLMFFTRRQQSLFVLIGSIAFTRLFINTLENFTNKKYKEISQKCIDKFTVFIIIAVVLYMSIDSYSKIQKTPYIDKKTYPIEASEWILQNLDTKKIRLYNEYNYGSYLLFKGIPVFIDSRADLYAPEFNTKTGEKEDGDDIFSEFINSSNIGKYYGDTFKKYNITHIILYKNSKINMIIEKTELEKYNKLYSDDYFVIYEILQY